MKKYLVLALLPLLYACSNSLNRGSINYDESFAKDTQGLDILTGQFSHNIDRIWGSEGPQNVINVLESTIEKIDILSKLENHSGVTGITTGFTDLDKKTAGLQPSDLIIVAARPSMGKTTFAMNLCENAAMTSEKPVLVFSLEMPAEQIMMRMIASLARVDQTKIRTGQNLDEIEWNKIATFSVCKDINNLINIIFS